MKLMGGDWQEIKKGKHGAILLRLAENVQHASQLANPTFDLVCEEDDHDEVENFDAYLRDRHAHKRYAELHVWVKNYRNVPVSNEASENVQIPVSIDSAADEQVVLAEDFSLCHELKEPIKSRILNLAARTSQGGST